MSAPAIYIELLGKTPHVPPRYTRSDSHLSGPILLWISWCGIPDLPYAIRKFGIRKSKSGIRGLGNRTIPVLPCPISLRPP